MKRRSCFSTFVLLALLGTACASTAPASSSPSNDPEAQTSKFAEPMPTHLTLDYRACTNDADCVLAQNGCCDCANGGEDIAVRRDRAAAFRERFRCEDGCTEIGGSCGQGTITCEEQLCVYRPPAP
jgi:hypothetical protein